LNIKSHTLKFIVSDLLSAAAGWLLFFEYRKIVVESEKFGYQIPIELDTNFWLALLLIPIYWLALYTITGQYRNVYRKARLQEFIRTFNTSLFGVLFLFFALLLDDTVSSYKAYYKTLIALFSLHFFLTYIGRYIIIYVTRQKIAKRQIGFNTIIVGNSSRAMELYNELEKDESSQGYFIRGFLWVDAENKDDLGDKLPALGHYTDALKVIKEKNIVEAIIAIESNQHTRLNEIINILEQRDVIIKIIPDMYDILTGSVKMNQLFGSPLIEVQRDIMPEWQQAVKRGLDILVSLIVLALFSPIYLIISILIKLDSKGSLFYSQERVGYQGKPFKIYKFRTMKVGAEKGTPQLSSGNDDRRTPIGIHLRKYRFDELPQFWNVLKGDMSLVGPRPERQFFIDQIVEKAPHYHHLLKVRPGVTSWGQVKFGYAENVDQMVERLKYDIIYIENMSLALDIRIMFYTILVVIKGRGK
jgi:exopolysaccharide biosynthesis polyprenyl glycosylphosphotransferase